MRERLRKLGFGVKAATETPGSRIEYALSMKVLHRARTPTGLAK
ncbi:MAG: hypothetical protein ACI90R_002321 [Alteromonas macleodii]|jgi:hypothetical protein